MNDLRDLTAVMTNQKALRQAGDRLVGIALGSAPPIRHKAAVASIGTADVAALADPDSQPLLAALQRESVPGSLLRFGAHAVGVNELQPAGGEDPEATWVVEGGGLPVARFSTSTVYTGPHHFGTLVPLSKDALKLSGGRAYAIARAMRGLVNGDNAIIDATAASASRPAGLLRGRTSVGGGSPEANLREALEELYAQVTDGRAVKPTFIVSGRGALYLLGTGFHAFKDLTVTGGTIAGAPAVIAPGAGDNLILVDSAQVLISDGGLEVSEGEHAAIEMADPSTQSSVTPTATQLVSAFQANVVVLRFLRYLSWALLREDAVGFIELPIGGSPA